VSYGLTGERWEVGSRSTGLSADRRCTALYKPVTTGQVPVVYAARCLRVPI